MFLYNFMTHFMQFMDQASFSVATPRVLSALKGCVKACTHFYALMCSPNFIWFVLAYVVLTVAFRYRRGVLRARASDALRQATQPRHMACGPDAEDRPPARSATSDHAPAQMQTNLQKSATPVQATGLMQTNLLKLQAIQKQLKQDILVLQITEMQFEKQRTADHAKFVVLMNKAISDHKSGLEIENHNCFLSSLHESNWVLNRQCVQRMQNASNAKLNMMFHMEW